MTDENRINIAEPALCSLLILAQITVSAAAIGSNPLGTSTQWIAYTDPLYAYTLPIPGDWQIAATPADVVIGVAVFTNYDPELAQQTGALPDDALRIQIGIAPIAPDESAESWLARWRAGQTADTEAARTRMGQPERMQIAGFETFSYTVNTASTQPGIELGLRLAQDQIAVIGISTTDGAQVARALNILQALQPAPHLNFHPVALEIAETWRQQVVAPLDIISLHQVNTPLQNTCPLGTFPGHEAPDSPISLRLPFQSGQRWMVGEWGSFYGNHFHCNANNDYYATDWNRLDGPDQGALLMPVANGIVDGTSGPTCPTTGYGCYVRIMHAEGIQTLYAHLSGISVTTGALVTAPVSAIGRVGNTGRSTDAHLHLSFRQLASGSYRSHCYNNGKTCPNGEAAASPQSAKPSPMFTATGMMELVDGGIYTSTDQTAPHAVYTAFLPFVAVVPAIPTAIYHDAFDVNSLSNYELAGSVTWDEAEQSVRLNYAADGSALHASWTTSQSLVLSGRVLIPADGIGQYDSVALAVRGPGVQYWATLAYGTALPQANHLSIMRNDTWGELAPIPLSPGWYIVRLDVDYAQGTLRAKAWPEGGMEPNWQISRTLDAGWTASAIGFRHFGLGTRADDLMVSAPAGP